MQRVIFRHMRTIGNDVDANVENKQLRGAVWNYFEKLMIEGQSKCLLCKSIIKHSNNTSNLAKVSCIFVFF